jgi:toxin ParE1/3/4
VRFPVAIRPRARRDLDDQAVYLAEEASSAIGYRFLLPAEETFALLASQPEIGWRPKVKRLRGLESLRMFTISGFEKMVVLYRPTSDGVEIVRVVHGSRDLRAVIRAERIE